MRPFRAPDETGPAGRAWKIAPNETTVVNYLIVAPGQNPFWHWFIFSVIDLADTPTAHRQFPDARWEFLVLALEPEHYPDPDNFRLHPLVPPNVVYQIPDHPIDLVVSCGHALLEVVLVGALPIDPLFTSTGPLSTSTGLARKWGEIITATLAHPYHHGECEESLK
ncbi:MAG: hypothetical protein L0Z49_04595 [Actinobacteria bacterium]|nr:hypothetical protein [Actinomycetota bacterium]